MAVFSCSVVEIDRQIVSHLIPREQVVFSFVNKNAYKMLNEDPSYFQKIFEKYSPFGPYLSIYYPGKAWKIGCYYISPQDKPLKFHPVLLQEHPTHAIQASCQVIHEKLQTICGTFYGDSYSEIHQAWIVLQNHKKEFASVIHSHQKSYDFLNWLINNVDHFRGPDKQVQFFRLIQIEDNPLEILQEIDDCFLSKEAIDAVTWFKKFHIACVKHSVNDTLTQEEDRMIRGLRPSETITRYEVLEAQRDKLQKKIDGLKSILNQLKRNSIKKEDCNKFRKINQNILEMIFETSYLEECLSVIKSPADCKHKYNRIQFLINACSAEGSKNIWEQLYHRAANGVQENRWSELHFHEHLHALSRIIKEKCTYSRDRLKGILGDMNVKL